MTEPDRDDVRVVVINAGVSARSSTRMLADRIAPETIDRFRAAGVTARLDVVDLAPLARDIAGAIVTGSADGAVAEALARVGTAEAVIAASPVYNAGLSGIFKSFVDVMDKNLLVARPMILAAAGGSPRHAMVLDNQMRPLFAFMQALPVPTAIFASHEDWGTPELERRIARAATELTAYVKSGVSRAMAGEARGKSPMLPAAATPEPGRITRGAPSIFGRAAVAQSLN